MKSGRSNSPHILPDAVKENIDTVAEFYAREEEKISGAQSLIEVMGFFFGSPLYLGGITLFVVVWTLLNIFGVYAGIRQFDPPPFFWLQGIVGLNGVLITIAVLIRQNRMARLGELHAHLGLQVNLLTEQKATKIIKLLEELRHDSPDLRDRADPEIAAMQMETNPHAVLNAIDAQQSEKRRV
jgi:uncharacterized membrane protein